MKISKIELAGGIALLAVVASFILNQKSEAEIECDAVGGKFLANIYCATTTKSQCDESNNIWNREHELCFDEEGDVVLGIETMPTPDFLKEVQEGSN